MAMLSIVTSHPVPGTHASTHSQYNQCVISASYTQRCKTGAPMRRQRGAPQCSAQESSRAWTAPFRVGSGILTLFFSTVQLSSVFADVERKRREPWRAPRFVCEKAEVGNMPCHAMPCHAMPCMMQLGGFAPRRCARRPLLSGRRPPHPPPPPPHAANRLQAGSAGAQSRRSGRHQQ